MKALKVIFLVSLSFFGTHHAVGQSTDIDGDSVDDFITTAASTTVTWTGTSGDDGSSLLSQTFGLATDLLVPGRWESSDSLNLGVVRKSGSSLVWKILLSDGTIFQETFGDATDVAISGGDFNGDGIIDAATASNKNGSIYWKIRYGFASGGHLRKTILASTSISGSKALYLNYNGRNDWIGMFYPNGSRATLFLLDPRTKRKKTVNKFPVSLTKSNVERPVPLRSSDGTDYLLFVSTDETDTTFALYSPRGRRLFRETFPGLGSFSVGDYLSTAEGQEFAFLANGSAIVVNPFENVIDRSERSISGTLIDHYSIGKLP